MQNSLNRLKAKLNMEKKLIVCVDDEQIVLTSLVGQLGNTFGNRFLYETFTEPEEAWEFIDETYAEGMDVHLIICDWLMPRMRGDEFMVRVHKRFPEVKMIMLSGQADNESVERARREANLLKFIAKPWEKTELMQEVETALEVS